MKRKIKFEYPYPCWTNCDPEYFGDVTMFDMTFQTTIHYFKNHSSGFESIVVKIFGFGFRIETRSEVA